MQLQLVPVHFLSLPGRLQRVTHQLEAVYGLQVEQVAPWFDPEAVYDPERGQYNALGLLSVLLQRQGTHPGRVLAVTAVDLFIPVLTYVFGEAQLDGPAAVVSSRRLDPQAYGLAADEALLQRRLEVEAVHEIGHTFGLRHCFGPRCAMRGATYAEEIDLKDATLCSECRQQLAGRP
ncbi:MAG: archaemetzincin [Pseudomonadota bacterium]